MTDIYGIVQMFWELLPAVALPALVVFLTVSLLKIVKVVGDDIQAQIANVAISYFTAGASGEIDMTVFMTMVVAGLYYHVWKFLKPYLQTIYDWVMAKIKKE